MKNRVITISREFGSGGRTIGKMVADHLGIPCYDAQILESIAKESGFTEAYIRDAGEYSPTGQFSNAFFNRTFSLSNEDEIWILQSRIIRELAEKGPCVIVGRCADSILNDTALCLKVFIHASLHYRADRIVRVYGETQESPLQRLRDKDKRRAAYHRFYTDMKWGHAQNYHISMDSGILGLEQCASIIEELYRNDSIFQQQTQE